MKKIKSILASALLIGMSAQTAIAQDYSALDYKPYPYAFVTLQGGTQITVTDYKVSKLFTPIGSVSVGGMFAPAIGARLNVNGWKTRSGLKSLNATYDFNYVNSNLDLMVNLTNVFMPKEHLYPVNFYLIGGVGLTYAWDNDDLKELMVYAKDKNLYHAWDDDRLVHNFRAGLQMEANLAKNVSLNLEVTANNMADRFNSKVNHRGDWQVQAMAGITFKFGYKKKEVGSLTSTTAQSNYNNNQNADMANAKQPIAAGKSEKVVTPAPKPAPKPVVKEETKKVHIFFKINSAKINESEEAKLKELAEWMKAHPDTKTELQGYADAKTGTRAYNKKISKQRTEAVTNLLIDKYGISKDRISTIAMGDAVQPFNENDKNRVVIGIAK